jgi:hypothetical protein
MLSQFVFKIIPVRRLYIIRKIAKESERWNGCWKLCNVFYFNGITPDNGRMMGFNGF